MIAAAERLRRANRPAAGFEDLAFALKPRPSPAEIEQSVRAIASQLIETAEAELAEHGFKVGALVDWDVKQRNAGRYVIAELNWGRNPANPTLWFYGRKVLADGSIGSHWHSLGGPKELRVIDPNFGRTPA